MPRKNSSESASTSFAGAETNPHGAGRRRVDAAAPGLRHQVRIIGGEWRGRKLHFPPLPAIRPTPDRVRETLFNWIQMQVPGSRCLDLFAGSGALGLEALSRGAGEVVFVESDPGAAAFVARTLQEFRSDRGQVVRADARAYLGQDVRPFDIVFLDPPFADRALADTCRLLEDRGWLQPGASIYLEAAADEGVPELPPGWTLMRTKRAGEVGYHLARRR
jgi:16S rRNA (guanine966-N2)-methyltransferase